MSPADLVSFYFYQFKIFLQMRAFLFYSIITLFTIKSLAQTHTETFQACGLSYTVTSEVKPDNSYKIIIKKDDTNKIEYEVHTNNFEIFGSMFKERFLSQFDPGNSCSEVNKNALLLFGNRLYTKIIAANTDDSPSSIPIAGVLKVMNNLKLHFVQTKTGSGITPVEYKISKVDIEIKDGFIENIKAYIIINNNSIPLVFTNIYAIGFSSLTNFKNLSRIRLYDINSPPLNEPSTDPRYYIILTDLINYDYSLGLDRRDYSPKEGRYVINGNEKMTLYKEETKKLFEAHVFSDFEGLNENSPNGLIQTEISKKIVINTIQYPAKFVFKAFKSFGFLAYITPDVAISKIEQHNKRLKLGDLDSLRLIDTSNSSIKNSLHRYATALDLFEFQSFSAGITGNLLNLTNHNLKYTFFLNFGARLGITPVTDSLTKIDQNKITKTGLTNDYLVNTLQFYPEAIISFLPDERFSLTMTDRLIYLQSANRTIQILSFLKQDVTKISPSTSNWINSFEMLMTIQVNPKSNSKLFGRVRFNSDMKNINNNFKQIQIGYSTYILGSK